MSKPNAGRSACGIVILMGDTFDYVIVGSGPAASLLANRLTEARQATACVLEAGPADTSRHVRIPAGFVKLLFNPARLWQYQSEPNAATAGRQIRLVQGRIVGGSSSLNGLVCSRGQADEFNDWAAWGNQGWSHAEVLPYFMRPERRIGPGDERYRGRKGALPITDPDWRHVLCDAFIKGAGELDVAYNQHYNGAAQEGAGYFQRNIYRGRRITCADAFLHPAIRCGGIDLRIEAHANSIVFKKKSMSVSAVRRLQAKRHRVRARPRGPRRFS